MKEQRLHQAFEIGIIIKAIDGALEIIGGFILLFISPDMLSQLARALTQHELSRDPHDFVANHILDAVARLTHSSTIFGGIYLLLHGIVKIVLVIAVGRDKLWAFPWMIGFILVFMIYQTYRIAIEPTFGMIALTLFDAVVVWLTLHEYKVRKAKSAEI